MRKRKGNALCWYLVNMMQEKGGNQSAGTESSRNKEGNLTGGSKCMHMEPLEGLSFKNTAKYWDGPLERGPLDMDSTRTIGAGAARNGTKSQDS